MEVTKICLIVVLAVVVSSWFHKTRRSQKTDCSLEEFIRHPRSGIAGIVWVVPEPASDGPASIG
jgi:hypothetical protein